MHWKAEELYIYIYIYIYIYTHTYIHAYMHTYTNMIDTEKVATAESTLYICTCICTYIHTLT